VPNLRDLDTDLGPPRVAVSTELLRVGKISKRGNRYLRVLFVQTAWAVLLGERQERLAGRAYATLLKSFVSLKIECARLSSAC
jgi:transposase